MSWENNFDVMDEVEIKEAVPAGSKRFRVNSFFGHYYRTISLTSEQSKIKEVFTAGNCHSFAVAVSKLTGWPLRAVFRIDDGDEIASHVFVEAPDGDYVDVTGKWAPNVFRGRWRGEIRAVNRQHILRWVAQWRATQCGYIPLRVKDSMPYAQRMLAKIGWASTKVPLT